MNNPKLFTFSLLVILLIVAFAADGQSRKELEKKRKSLINQIKKTGSLLSDTRNDKKSTVGQLVGLQDKIKQREALINTIKSELEQIDTTVIKIEEVAVSYETELALLKSDYKKMMRQAYRSKGQHKRIFFLLAAENVNNAIKRWHYLERYDVQCQHQAQHIIDMQDSLVMTKKELERTKAEKIELLALNEDQQTRLNNELSSKDKLLKKLEAKESKLMAALAKQEKAKEALSNAIDKAIRTDIQAAKKRALTNRHKSASASPATGESRMATNFRKAKGKLIFPVTGKIVSRFGKQPHPNNARLTINNNGIDIETSPKATAKSVFEGQVVTVFSVPSNQNAVMIKHGNYYTVYSNLEKVKVKKGDIVKKSQAIGTVGKNNERNRYELHFEVWYKEKRQNPQSWLK